MKDVIFKLIGIYYSYADSVPALVDINLEVERGEKLVIVGANGSGKSTLLKIMDALIFPQRGEFTAFGKVVDEREMRSNPYEFRKRVGLVFQDSDVQLFSPSVFDEVAFGPLQLSEEPEKVRDLVESILDDFGIGDLRDRPPHRLSGGEKKKVALASVMALNPEVLLLDEPTNGLDPRSRKWLVRKLLELNRKGTTVVTATHDLEIAKQLADRMVVMGEGHRIERTGASEEVFADEKLLLEANLI
ncbi:energy-coupling factor ABC transporter ATP-binding protein [Caldanaerobius polysaccharolyticus]|uniref:energy-coupling factor ABC transporter ATP-binding protein n=1 Tax=Caldanaerobius polysaccharolyticus TaxID=44256 RepID=UPI00055610B7|nr:ABC transporter ATP-binding protein [Caldanaerobius polysaccharolyticus]